MGWSGQSDGALRRAILESTNRLYGRYFGVGLGPLHEDLVQDATKRGWRTMKVDDADRFFDQLGGAVDELTRQELSPLDLPALLRRDETPAGK